MVFCVSHLKGPTRPAIHTKLGLTLIDAYTMIMFLVATAIFAVGAYKDWKTLTVGNDLWLIGGCVGALGALVFFRDQSLLMAVYFIPFVLFTIGGFLFWNKFDAYIGAADIKAMMALSLLIGYFSFIVVGLGVLFAGLFSVIKILRNKGGDITKVQAPFIPFMFASVLTVAFWFALN